MSQRYDLPQLLDIMARLRDPNGGCPWDLKQSFQTIVPHTLEEAYEVPWVLPHRVLTTQRPSVVGQGSHHTQKSYQLSKKARAAFV